ncbi:MAG: hypothetical protein C4538_12740 [Nitrospiraceae bacterium]|nr:MAG: hypothetical protein C4538_12740 [Nitrospiraceae bacterium]
MGLKEYKSKRKFEKTPEPKPELRPEGDALIFVIHKHAARNLHYDLRLELDGVLKSWAVPKGPSLDPSLKRLAMMVEDHPFDYKDFEGVIPEGNYGAGSVIIWDRGFYHHPSAKGKEENEKFLREGLKKGDLKFVLKGEKLQGEFALVRMRRDEKSWLLMKKKDQYANESSILKENRSVLSGKTLEEVAEAGQGKSPKKKLDRIRQREALESEDLKDAPVKPAPHNIKPMLATLVKEPFDDPEWIFELKWDGYRAIAEMRERDVSLYSRNHISLNRKYPPVAEALQKLSLEAVLDGEIVVVDEQGHPNFQMLQDYQKTKRGHLVYYVFDLLYFKGHDLTGLPLLRRKEILRKILPSHASRIKFSDHVLKDGVLFFRVVSEKGLEGIIAKHAQSLYQTGKRSRQWLKVKTRLTQKGVIAGFTEPGGGRKYFGSLVLGVFEANELVYIGHSGGGFGAKALRTIYEKLYPLIRKECPFKTEPETNAPVTWVKPEIVCELTFAGWTGDGIMRQPVFSRLREDKTAHEVVREKPSSHHSLP